MPTARELLEQADALMRRDRDALAAGDRARPASTPVTLAPRSLTGPALSPRSIQREPIAPSVARTSLPIHPTDSPAFSAPAAPWFAPAEAPAPPADASPAEPVPVHEEEPTPEADFPTLTDAVVEIVETAEDAVAFAPDDTGDVPVLTDAVEAGDGAEVDVLEREEPSTGDVAESDETSVLEAAPDAVVGVPPLDEPPIAPPTGRDPLGLDQPAPGFVAPAWALAPADTVFSAPEAEQTPEVSPEAPMEAAPEAARETAQEAEPVGEPERPVEAPAMSDHGVETVLDDDAELEASMAMPPLHGEVRARPVADHVALAGFAPLRPQPGYEAPSTLDLGEEIAPPASEAVPEVHALPPAAAPVLDDARVAEAVEEIRMQVLQRIDIFTDTTLRAKLGEQLQPLVERASADLVAAINQHVGDLLRTYVAEALEQEIEHWRNSQR
jgi:hypothetical protein